MDGENKAGCPDCGKVIIVTNHELGESYCSRCGFVLEEAFDYSMRWYGDEGTNYQKTSHTRAYKGLGTIDPNTLPRHKGMKAVGEEKIERNFANASHALYVVWGLWHVPIGIRAECAIQYRKMIKKGITHGRNKHAMALASTFMICEKHGITRDLEEMLKTLNLSHITVEKCLKAIAEI